MIKPNSWNSWDPLKTCLVGTCLNENFFSSIKDTKLRDSLTRIIVETNEDLENFSSELRKNGVEVIEAENEPYFQETFHDTVTWLREKTWGDEYDELRLNGLFKPNITPRDYLITMGDKMLLTTKNNKLTEWCKKLFDDADAIYLRDTGAKFLFTHEKWQSRGLQGEWHMGFGAPCITRVGENVIVDTQDISFIKEFLEEHFPKFEYKEIKEGGHNDGIYCTVKPGHIISVLDPTLNIYEKSFPNWDLFFVEKPEPLPLKEWQNDFSFTDAGLKWWTDDMHENPALQKFVDEWLNNWVGYCEESIFEVNMLSLSEDKIMGSVRNTEVEKHLEKIGTEFIHVPFRHRRFWDGGLHCLTVDLVREGQQNQYNL